MKKYLVGLMALATIAFIAPSAQAKIFAVYGAGHAGFMNEGENDPGFGLMLGGRVLILDGYVDYTNFGQSASVSRGILGLRGGFGSQRFRLVLRGGGGAIHEQNGALTGPSAAPDRTGVVGRAGFAIEGAVNPLLYLGFGVDGERYRFADNAYTTVNVGSDLFAALRLTFEVGI